VICTITTAGILFLKYETFSGSYEDRYHSRMFCCNNDESRETKDYLHTAIP
jgi:hypothetical protein